MTTVLVAAITGLIGGVIASLIAPWVQWAIEKRRNRLSERKETIKSWRRLIDVWVHAKADYYEIEEFSHTPEYSTMKQHLSPRMRHWVEHPLEERVEEFKEYEHSA